MNLGMMKRRMNVGENPNANFGYISDGLVFHLDGIDNGGVTGQWIDRIGGVIFTEQTGADLHDTNGYTFASGNWFKGNKNCVFPYATHTIEVCFRTQLSYWFGVCSFGTNNVGLFHQSGTGFYGGRTTTNINRTRPNNTNIPYKTIGSANGKFVINGTEETISGTGKRTVNVNTPTLGNVSFGSGYDSTYPFTGKIFAIRVYNRLLTTEELRSNFLVDNERFELGITT